MSTSVVTAAVYKRPNPKARPERPADWREPLERARCLLAQLAELTGDDSFAAESFDATDFDAVVLLLDSGVEALLHRLREVGDRPPPTRTTTLLTELYSCQRELRERGAQRRLRGLTNIQEGLSRLHAATTMACLLEMAPGVLCGSCGFERCVVFRVDGSELVSTGVHVDGDPARAAELLAFTTAQPLPLTSLVIETEMLRRRAPAIIHDAVADPRTFKPFVTEFATTSYVATPVLFESRVIGFVHADCAISGRAMDTIDRDLLWAFAEGLAWAVERATLMERLDAQRAHVHRMLASTASVLDEISAGGVAMSAGGQRTGNAAVMTAARIVAPHLRMDTQCEALLTSREREVLALLGTGATNAEIAQQLVIAEGTVKSHVKHVLRKLRASNRAEAVSRYLRLAGQEAGR